MEKPGSHQRDRFQRLGPSLRLDSRATSSYDTLDDDLGFLYRALGHVDPLSFLRATMGACARPTRVPWNRFTRIPFFVFFLLFSVRINVGQSSFDVHRRRPPYAFLFRLLVEIDVNRSTPGIKGTREVSQGDKMFVNQCTIKYLRTRSR